MTLKLTYAGFNYVADVDGSYSASSLPSMVSQTDANSVALTADYGIDAATNTVYADYSTGTTTGSTESIADIETAAQAAEAQGLSVIIRPLLDYLPDATASTLTGSNGNVYADGDWRAYYNPGSISAGISFLQSYEQTVLIPLAKVAQTVGAQVLDLGTEIDQLTGPAYQATWNSIIADVKTYYTGQLTYSAIGDDDLSPWQYAGYADANTTNAPAAGTGNLNTQVSFWNKLDYVGIDNYSALSNANDTALNGRNPSLQDLINGWEQPFTDDGQGTPTDTTAEQTNGLSLIQYYEDVASVAGKPLLFTELGYNSAPDAASQPFFTSSSSYDPALQAQLYQAFFNAWQADGNTSLKGVWFWNWEPDPSTVGAGSGPNWTPQDNTQALADAKAGFDAADSPQCFVAGTQITTPSGPRPVEALAAGDLVVTASGRHRAISWLGHRKISCRSFADRTKVMPIRILAHAFGPDLPARDLLLSPEHAVFVREVLIAVKDLVNGTTITQVECDQVRYWHIELETHDVIFAENLPVESFLENDNRQDFDGQDALRLYPPLRGSCGGQNPCAPVVRQGMRLEAIRQTLALREAGVMSHQGVLGRHIQSLNPRCIRDVS
jgi:hypothetical protein